MTACPLRSVNGSDKNYSTASPNPNSSRENNLTALELPSRNWRKRKTAAQCDSIRSASIQTNLGPPSNFDNRTFAIATSQLKAKKSQDGDTIAHPPPTAAPQRRQTPLLALPEHADSNSDGDLSNPVLDNPKATPSNNIPHKARAENSPSPLLPNLHAAGHPRNLQPALLEALRLPHALQVPPTLRPTASSRANATPALHPLSLLQLPHLFFFRGYIGPPPSPPGAREKVQRDKRASSRDARAARERSGALERA